MHASPQYLALQKQLHETNEHYGISGQSYAEIIARLCNAKKFGSILDYGCGKGTLKRALQGIAITEFDPAISGKDDRALLTEHDLVVCTDVLEHIEPEFVTAVLADLRRYARCAAFVAVHTGPAMKTLADGRNAHLIQSPPRWWLEEFWHSGFTLQQFNLESGGFVALLS